MIRSARVLPPRMTLTAAAGLARASVSLGPMWLFTWVGPLETPNASVKSRLSRSLNPETKCRAAAAGHRSLIGSVARHHFHASDL